MKELLYIVYFKNSLSHLCQQRKIVILVNMYVGIDVGGTKTLATVLDENGIIVEKVKFATPKNYNDFLKELGQTFTNFHTREYAAGGIGIPVTVFDRSHERAINFSNLPWHNVHVQHDVEQICGCPFVVDNDAKMAGLSEAMLLKNQYSKVLYVTVSTGIGFAIIDHCKIDDNVGDGGGRTMLLEHKGKLVSWESFASGHAIVERFGKKAVEITDEETWKVIAHDLSLGIIELIAFTEPEVIVIGGSVGTYFNKYGDLLAKAVLKYSLPLVKIPPIRGAERPEDAVVYGCYDLARQVYAHAKTTH
jgi:predicted NBD/HSP70 family sugar kinase